jgi:hypothetical protein
VSDHYPALSFQAQQFLNFETTTIIQPPFVLDIFTLDTMAEMLDTPFYFLSYVNRRTGYQEKLFAGHELTVLSYHLKRNLWFDKKYSLVQLGDDVTADLDVAMLVRREGRPGESTPDGILTRLKHTRVGEIVRDIESRPHPGTINLGFALLKLSENTAVNLSSAIDALARRSSIDHDHHDLTAPDTSVRFGISLDFPWIYEERMEGILSEMPRTGLTMDMTSPDGRARKIGRNEPCPCGSGRKYKKCCLL